MMSQQTGSYNNNESDHIDNLDHSSLYPSMNHKIDLIDPDKDRKELREAIRLMLEEGNI